MQTIRPLLLKLRETNPKLAIAVKQGQMRLESVVYDSAGKSAIEPLTDWMTPSAIVTEMQRRAA